MITYVLVEADGWIRSNRQHHESLLKAFSDSGGHHIYVSVYRDGELILYFLWLGFWMSRSGQKDVSGIDFIKSLDRLIRLKIHLLDKGVQCPTV